MDMVSKQPPQYEVSVFSHRGTAWAYGFRFSSLVQAVTAFHEHARAALHDWDCSVLLMRVVGTVDGVTLAAKQPDAAQVVFLSMFYAEMEAGRG